MKSTHILSHVCKNLLLDLTLAKLLLEGGLGRRVEHLLPRACLVRAPREKEPSKATTRGVSLIESDQGCDAMEPEYGNGNIFSTGHCDD